MLDRNAEMRQVEPWNYALQKKNKTKKKLLSEKWENKIALT